METFAVILFLTIMGLPAVYLIGEIRKSFARTSGMSERLRIQMQRDQISRRRVANRRQQVGADVAAVDPQVTAHEQMLSAESLAVVPNTKDQNPSL